ncbi:hypothetical protein GRJ2_002246800 [Grus japonensis]|uniref:Uncharacterized protein n=1 Tax=Grus japonensis TaxID=30415 RepID=A0ABC9XKL1_GRUJA
MTPEEPLPWAQTVVPPGSHGTGGTAIGLQAFKASLVPHKGVDSLEYMWTSTSTEPAKGGCCLAKLTALTHVLPSSPKPGQQGSLEFVTEIAVEPAERSTRKAMYATELLQQIPGGSTTCASSPVKAELSASGQWEDAKNPDVQRQLISWVWELNCSAVFRWLQTLVKKVISLLLSHNSGNGAKELLHANTWSHRSFWGAREEEKQQEEEEEEEEDSAHSYLQGLSLYDSQ